MSSSAKKLYAAPILAVLGRVGQIDPTVESALAEREALRKNLKTRIAAMSTRDQQERYQELGKKVADRVILANEELEEFVLLRKTLKQTTRK